MTPTPKPRRISREEAIATLAEMRQAYAILGQDAAAQNQSDFLREKVKKCIESADMAIRALKREQKAAGAKKKEEAKR